MSLKEIAEELGMSRTTVSRALNGYPEVSEKTRQKVKAAAERLRYQPDQRARSLALGRADAVGMVFPMTPGDLGDSMFLEVVGSMSDRFSQDGLDTLIISASEKDELAAYQRTIANRRVASFVVARTRMHDERLELLQSQNVPFVAYGRSGGLKQPYAWMDFDNEAGSRLAAERLIAFGHRHFGYLGAPPSYNFADLRFQGFTDALNQHSLGSPNVAVQRDALDRRSGYAAMQRLLALPQPPSAVFVDNHLAGTGAVHAALQAGKVLGKDLSLIVYDGLSADTVIANSITSVSQPTPSLVGLVLAELTLALLNGEAPDTLQRLRMPVLVPGESDGPVVPG